MNNISRGPLHISSTDLRRRLPRNTPSSTNYNNGNYNADCDNTQKMLNRQCPSVHLGLPDSYSSPKNNPTPPNSPTSRHDSPARYSKDRIAKILYESNLLNLDTEKKTNIEDVFYLIQASPSDSNAILQHAHSTSKEPSIIDLAYDRISKLKYDERFSALEEKKQTCVKRILKDLFQTELVHSDVSIRHAMLFCDTPRFGDPSSR